MIFIVVWLHYHFTLKSTLTVNCVSIITFIGYLHVWVTNSKPSLTFFQLHLLTLKNIIWENFAAVLFDKTQHVIKTSTTDYVPVSNEIINLFIKPQNFVLKGLAFFFIRKLKGLYLIVTVCCGLLMFFLYFFYTFFGESFY